MDSIQSSSVPHISPKETVLGYDKAIVQNSSSSCSLLPVILVELVSQVGWIIYNLKNHGGIIQSAAISRYSKLKI